MDIMKEKCQMLWEHLTEALTLFVVEVGVREESLYSFSIVATNVAVWSNTHLLYHSLCRSEVQVA